MAFSTTERINSAPPLGITRSTKPLAVSRAETVERSSEGINWTTSWDIFEPAKAVRITSTNTLLLSDAVADPRSNAAFPDLIKITAASTVTLGRAS